MFRQTLVLSILSVLFPIAVAAQSPRQSLDRKTIEISATEKVQLLAEAATVKIGYQNQAATKDLAYAENTRMANKIIQAVIDAGVSKEAIETESLSLQQEQERYGAKPGQPLKYIASQKWQIHSKAAGGPENRRHCRRGRCQ